MALWAGNYLPAALLQPFYSEANAISADGSTIVGYGRIEMSEEEVARTTEENKSLKRYTIQTVIEGEPQFKEVAFREAAILWDKKNGMRELAKVLEGLGVDLAG